MKNTSIVVLWFILGAFAHADTVYWANFSTKKLFLSDESVTKTKRFNANAGAEFAVTCNGSHVYWADGDSNTIKRANLDGTNATDLLIYSDIPSVSVGDIEVSDSFIFWSQTAGVDHAIYYANLDGSNIRKSSAWGVRPSTKIGVDQAQIFIPAYKSIWKHDTNTGISTQVLGGLSDSPWYIGYNNGYLYWAYSAGGKIYRAQPNDSAFQLVIEVAHPIEDFDFTSRRIYMSSANFISSCLIDGSELRTSRLQESFIGRIGVSDEVLIPDVSIETIGGQRKVKYSGLLKRSIDLKSWEALTPQPGSPWEVPIDSPACFFRAESTYP